MSLIKKFKTFPQNTAILLIAVSSFYSVTFSTQAQGIFYVREGAVGEENGSDWNNAFTSLPSNFIRGATYYVADGTYGSQSFDEPASGSSLITIKKATISNHGTDSGWNNGFGDGQAVFSGSLNFQTSDWVFDGQVRNEEDWSDNSSYGFHVKYTGSGTGVKLLKFSMGKGAGNVKVKHTAFTHAGGSGAGSRDGRDIVYSLGGQNNTMTRCLFYNAGRVHFLFRGCTGYIVEYSWIDTNESNSSEHGESCSALNSPNCVFRFNHFQNIQGTGVLVFGQNSPGWKIYGNIVDKWTSNANGVFTCWTVEFAENAEIYNNTIMNCANGRIGYGTAKGFKSYNNLFLNTPNISFSGANHSHDYNSADSHLDEGNGELLKLSTLKELLENASGGSPTAPGLDLGPEYERDMYGNKRGADGGWDRGAVEYSSVSGTTPLTISSSSISSLTSSSVMINWTTSKPATSFIDYGTTPSYSLSTSKSTLVIAHTLTLENLAPDMTYYYRIRSTDGDGQERVSAEMTFRTLPVNDQPSVLPTPFAYWNFEEGFGNTTVDKMSGIAIDFRNGAAWSGSGKFGNSLSLDGLNDHAIAQSNPRITSHSSGITVAAWVRLENQNNWQQILAKVNDTNAFKFPYFSWHLFGGPLSSTEWRPQFQLMTSSGNNVNVSSSYYVAYGQWAHVAGVYDGSTVKIYVNGIERGSESQSGEIAIYDMPLIIGAHGLPGEFAKGSIDEVRYFAHALSPQEIALLHSFDPQSSIPAPPTDLRLNLIRQSIR